MPYLLARSPLGEASTSWLGGLPTIPSDDWPRAPRTGLPMHCLARIDLAALVGTESHDLPQTGSLCFFADTDLSTPDENGRFHGRVIHSEGSNPSCPPPSDIPAPYGTINAYELGLYGSHPLDRFYHVPVTPVPVSAAALDKAPAGVSYDSVFNVERDGLPLRRAAVERLVSLAREHERFPPMGSREQMVNSIDYVQTVVDTARRFDGMTGAEYRDAMRKARVSYSKPSAAEQIEADLARIESMQAELPTLPTSEEIMRPLTDRLRAIADGGPPHECVSQVEYDDLVECARSHVGVASSKAYQALDRQMHGVLVDLAYGENQNLDLMPPSVIAHWNENPHSFKGPHTFMGAGDPIQELPEDLKDQVCLLHLVSDPVQSFQWGDMGVVQFWISREDLQNAAWEKATFRLAGH